MASWIKYFFLLLYLIDVAVNLLSIHYNKMKYFAVTKPLLMPLLLTSYLCFSPGKPGAELVVTALVFHTLGDLFLLFPKTKTNLWFYLGAISFFAGHLFYIFWFARPVFPHSFALALIGAIPSIVFEIYLAFLLLPKNKPMGLAMMVYSAVVCAVLTAIASTFGPQTTTAGALISFAGITVFLISDYTIARREFKLRTLGQMFTMTTYIVAQTLIVLGMFLMQR